MALYQYIYGFKWLVRESRPLRHRYKKGSPKAGLFYIYCKAGGLDESQPFEPKRPLGSVDNDRREPEG